MIDRKKIFAGILITVFSGLLAGCTVYLPDKETAPDPAARETAEQDVTTQDSTEQDIGEHISPDGWAVNYAVPVMEAHEIDEHTASFVYTGESAGTNMVTISYVPGKQPEEAMTEITDTWGDDETLERSEGFFPGTEDKWGYWRSIAHAENGSGFSETLIGGEYNGGVLLFDIVSHNGSDEEQNITVSDHLSAVIDSIRYENFGPQTMYEYYPGTYSRTDEDTGAVYSVILNEDHTGTLAFQDSVDIFWGSYQVTTTDGNYVYEYTIEGDDLLFDHNGIWATYTREGTDRD
ncbi:MAG: hypothetical protein IJR19_11380 [Lachnospiraceae bacterium]|nr:hypothetical protein [Lachnospiraceae bacterium]MBQ7261947.1 hypothetical protein [Lachnospiraceae bacterium]